MSILSSLSAHLKDKRLEGVNPESEERLIQHRNILETKPMMREIFSDFYQAVRAADEKYLSGDGARIEVGAGVSFFKKIFPDVLVTDIQPAAHLDQVMDALALPVAAGSVRVVYGINCFHHFPDIPRFFTEMRRALLPGGGIVLIEPYHGPVARLLYRHLFTTETFDTRQPGWESEAVHQGVMLGANQALSYIVFRRDRQLFEKLFPEFEILVERPFTNYLRYLTSGGLNFNALVPARAVPLLKCFEFLLTPFARIFGLHHLIVIRKRRV